MTNKNNTAWLYLEDLIRELNQEEIRSLFEKTAYKKYLTKKKGKLEQAPQTIDVWGLLTTVHQSDPFQELKRENIWYEQQWKLLKYWHDKEQNPEYELQEIELLCEEYPNNLAILNELGQAYIRKSRFTDAEKTFLRALEVDPKDLAALNELGYLYIKTHNYYAALKILHSARILGPCNRSIVPSLLKVYRKMKRYEEAETVIHECEKHLFYNRYFRYECYLVYMEQGKTGEAQRYKD